MKKEREKEREREKNLLSVFKQISTEKHT